MGDETDIELQNKLDEVRRHYLLPIDLRPIATEVKQAAEGTPEWLSSTTTVFLENVEAAITTATIPYTLAVTHVLAMRFRQLTIKNRISVASDELTIEMLHGEESPKEQTRQNKIAYERTVNEFKEEQLNLAVQTQLKKEWINFLLEGIQDKQMETASTELLRQSTVMLWGTFEVLCRDLFVGYLNNTPTEVQKLTANAETKKIFQAKAIDLDELSKYSYDVSKNLGDVFANMYDLSSLGAIKQTFNTLFPLDQDLHNQLSGKNFWLLHQRRHLIVHRRAVVDRQYLEATGENIKVGQRITPTPTEIKEYIKLVCHATLFLVKAMAKK